MTGEGENMAGELAQAQSNIVDSFDEEDEVQAEGQEPVETDAEEGASREDDTPDADEAEKEVEAHGPEWAKKRVGVVTAKRREAEKQRDEAKAELEALKAELAAAKKRSNSRSVFDDEDEDEPDDEKSQLQKRLDAIEKKEQERELNRIVSETKAKYPNLPDVVMYAALAQGVDIDDAATNFDAIVESIVSERLAAAKKKDTPAKPPVTVAGRTSAGSGKVQSTKPEVPKLKGAAFTRAIQAKLRDFITNDDD